MSPTRKGKREAAPLAQPLAVVTVASARRPTKRNPKKTKVSQGGFTKLGVPVQLGKPTKGYLETLHNPRSVHGYGIPTTLPLNPSQKSHSWVEGTLTIGTTGVGFVTVSANAANDLTSSAAAVQYTGSTFATSLIATVGTTGVTGVSTNSPFTNAQFAATAGSTGVQWRPVAMMLEAYPSTAALSFKGTVLGLQTPEHDSMIGMASTDFSKFEDEHLKMKSIELITQKKKLYLRYSPSSANVSDASAAQADETEYCPTSNAFGGLPFMGFMILGTAGDTWEFRLDLAGEYVGTICNARTINKPDPMGFAAVQSAVHQAGHFIKPRLEGDVDQGGGDSLERLIVAVATALAGFSCPCPMGG